MKRTMTSPRANSTFKTLETRETYRMVEEIMHILNNSRPYKEVTSHSIINIGNMLGFCRPLHDKKRIADSHPYIKILSMMTDPTSVHFINNLEEIHNGGGKCYSYRLRGDFFRSKKGHWHKVKGMKIMAIMPKEY